MPWNNLYQMAGPTDTPLLKKLFFNARYVPLSSFGTASYCFPKINLFSKSHAHAYAHTHHLKGFSCFFDLWNSSTQRQIIAAQIVDNEYSQGRVT